MSRFANKTALVTGATFGLGQTVAQAFAREGADIAIIGRSHSGAETEALVKAEGRRCATFLCDVRDEDAVKKAVAGASDFLGGRIDVLVNNAGFNGYHHLIKDMTLAHWRYTLDTNLTGTMLVTREVLPRMISAGGGRIVITASNVSRRGLPYRGDYVCTKWALLGLTQTLALENAANNIRVNAVCPGPVEGERIEDIMVLHAKEEGKSLAEMRTEWENAAAMKRFVTAQEVANAMLFLCSDESSAMTGQALNVTGGFLMT